MSTVAGKRLLYILQLYQIAGVSVFKIFQFPLVSALRLLFDLPDNLAGLGQIYVPAKVIDAVLQREDLRLLIEIQLKLAPDVFRHLLQAFFQVLFIRVDQNAIVHIAGIVLDPQPLFDQPVEAVEVVYSKPLAGLISHRQPFSWRNFKAVDDLIQQVEHVCVGEYSRQLFLQDFVVDAVEKLVNVTFQEKAVCAVFVIVSA